MAEKIVEIDLWSDDWAGNNIINVLHDVGIKTAGMHTEINGTFESKVEWERCKTHEIPSICVCLKGDAMKSIAENVHSIDEVEEKPLFLYKVNIIDDVPDGDDEEEEESKKEDMPTEEEETEMLKSAIADDMDMATIGKNIKDSETEEKTYTAILNVGLTTADKKHELDSDKVINFIGMYIDCTITKTIGSIRAFVRIASK